MTSFDFLGSRGKGFGDSPTLDANRHCLFLALPARSERVIALATIYWPTFTGLEGHLSIFATLGTDYRVHLPPRPRAVATISVTPGFPGLAALRTALWLVSVAFRSKKLLLPGSEGERLVFKSHWMTSLFKILR